MWWLFTSTKSSNLSLYYADNLEGPWTGHPDNPIIEHDRNVARSGGRVLVLKDQIIRYAQDDYPIYGNQVRAFRITQLTVDKYTEEEVKESPVLTEKGSIWNIGMHHIDPHQVAEEGWITCVDGKREELDFGLRY